MIGTSLSHFEITAELGAGGMGEVYRATDTRLGREVAIKVLPEAFVADPERLARFEREARVLASLNHPNIAAIFEVGEAVVEGRPCHFLVMELVEGEDLAERLERGAVPVDESIAFALQLARALEAAHERGIVHRDLKPSNIKLSESGELKVLDFGLAKALEGEPGEAVDDLSGSPTLTYQPTVAGVLLGTAAYMSPEQARGRPVDKRADIWAFGVVLWEMLTGRRLFHGESVSDVLAAVLRQEPSLDALPPAVPPRVRRLLARCLERDPLERLRDIGEARITLAAEPDGLPIEERGGRFGWGAVAASALGAALVVALVAAILLSDSSRTAGSPEAAASRVSFSFRLPEDHRLEQSSPTRAPIELAPDGSFVVFSARSGEEPPRIFRRSIDSLEIVPVAGGEGGRQPFVSPDGRWIGFFTSDGALFRVAAEGGLPERIYAGERLLAMGAWWGSDGRVYFARGLTGGIAAVPVEGGDPVQLTTPDADAGEIGHWHPKLLPGGEELLFGAWTVDGWRNQVLELATGELVTIETKGSHVYYVRPGHLLWLEGRDLIAAPFVLGPGRLLERGRPVLSGLSSFHAAPDGTIAYVTRSSAPLIGTPMRWSEALGATALETGGGGNQIRVAPGGRRLAVAMIPHVWVVDLERGVRSPLTSDGVINNFPVWSTDGAQIAFNSLRAPHGLYVRSADGLGEARLVLERTSTVVSLPASWAPDGSSIAMTELHPDGQADVAVVDVPSGATRPLVATEAVEHSPAISPDGRWLAYVSDVSGREEVYVRPFAEEGPRATVSTAGGTDPRWSSDGRTLLFRDGSRIFAASVSAREGGVDLGVPRLEAELPGMFESNVPFAPVWDVAPNGDLIYLGLPEAQPGGDEIFVLYGWGRELVADS